MATTSRPKPALLRERASVRLTRLHRVLGLVCAQAGEPAPPEAMWRPGAVDWAYGEAATILQARFDDASAQASAIAAAGVEALLRGPSQAAAAELARAVAEAIDALEALLEIPTRAA